MILLDSNILIYATGAEHRLRPACQTVIAAAANGVVDAYLTDVVITEFLHVRARRSDRRAAAALARDLLETIGAVISADDRARARAFTLYAASERLSSNDALIAGIALEHGLTLVSADRDFGAVTGLDWIPPELYAGAGGGAWSGITSE